MDSSSPVLESSRKASNLVLWLFAGVGFIAAIVQIAQYLWPNSSELKVAASIQQPVTQHTIVNAIKSDADKPGFMRSILDADKKYFCDFEAKPTSSKGDAEIAASKCEDIKAALGVFDLIAMNPDFRVVTYDLENTGSQIAREVRINSKDVTEVDVASGANTRGIERNAGGDFYKLPDLNPGEKLSVAVWTTSYLVDPKSDFLTVHDLPKITFSGGKPDITLLRPIPSFYADMKYFLDLFPLPISILLVIVLCVLVTMLVVAFFTAIDALLKGKSLSAAFGTDASKTSNEISTSAD